MFLGIDEGIDVLVDCREVDGSWGDATNFKTFSGPDGESDSRDLFIGKPVGIAVALAMGRRGDLNCPGF